MVLKRDSDKLISRTDSCRNQGNPQKSNGDSRASDGSTSAPSAAGSVHCRVGDAVADRTDWGAISRTGKGHVGSDSGSDATRSYRRQGRYFILKGIAEQDFGEWTHKVCTFILASFGDQILGALTWAARQRRIVVKACGSSQKDRFVPWTNVSGEQADETDQIDGIDDFRWKALRILSLLYNRRTQLDRVRNAGEGNGLEAWRRLHGEHDPTSSMRRVAILQQVQNPLR